MEVRMLPDKGLLPLGDGVHAVSVSAGDGRKLVFEIRSSGLYVKEIIIKEPMLGANRVKGE